jgi:hypothetical protein
MAVSPNNLHANTSEVRPDSSNRRPNCIRRPNKVARKQHTLAAEAAHKQPARLHSRRRTRVLRRTSNCSPKAIRRIIWFSFVFSSPSFLSTFPCHTRLDANRMPTLNRSKQKIANAANPAKLHRWWCIFTSRSRGLICCRNIDFGKRLGGDLRDIQ